MKPTIQSHSLADGSAFPSFQLVTTLSGTARFGVGYLCQKQLWGGTRFQISEI